MGGWGDSFDTLHFLTSLSLMQLIRVTLYSELLALDATADFRRNDILLHG